MSYTETRTLSMRKDRQKIHAVEPVYLRQGDCGAIIEGLLEDNGQPFDLSGADIMFKANNAGGLYLSETATIPEGKDAADGIVDYLVSTLLTQKHGKAVVGYFVVGLGKSTKDNVVTYTEVYTSDAIPIVVFKAADMSPGEAQQYENELDALIKEMNEKLDAALKDASDKANAEISNIETIEDQCNQILQTLQDALDKQEITDPTVTQTQASGAGAYPIIVKNTTDEKEETGFVKFVSGVTVVPENKTITADTFVGYLNGNADTATSATSAGSLGTTSAGSSTEPVYFSRGMPYICDNTLDVNISGSANQLTNARTVTLNGDVSASVSFDGSKDISSTVTLENSGITANSYGQSSDLSPNAGETFIVPYITFDAKGRATAAANRTITLPSAQGETGTADKLSCGDVGDTTIPVHFEDGIPKVCDGYTIGALFTVELISDADKLTPGDVVNFRVRVKNLSKYANLTITDMNSDYEFSANAGSEIIYVSPTVSNKTVSAGQSRDYSCYIEDAYCTATGEGTFTLTVTVQSDYFTVDSNTITITV